MLRDNIASVAWFLLSTERTPVSWGIHVGRDTRSSFIKLIELIPFLIFYFILASLGLNGIKVIIKSLGSGFHLPVPGLPRHDLVKLFM